MAAPDTFTVSPLVLARLGLPSIERLCERAGVAPGSSLRTSEFFQLWSAAEEAIGDRDAGLRFGADKPLHPDRRRSRRGRRAHPGDDDA
jgi:hypothetical protein